MGVGELVAGAVVGAATGHVIDKVEDSYEQVTGDNSHGSIPDHYRMIIKLLSRTEKHMRNLSKQLAPDVWQAIVLTNTGTVDFNNRGYKHCWMLCTASFKLNYATQAGTIQYVTLVGWNNFDLPMKTQIGIDPSSLANAQIVLFFSNDAKNLPGLTS